MFKGIGNVSLTMKICLAGLFAALTTVLQKVLAINYLPAFPFFRISFGGPAIIAFASIFLGPIWGAAVGGISDILGYLIFDPKSNMFMPLITLIYVLLGFAAFFVYKLIDKIGKDRKILIIEIALLLGAFIGLSCYIINLTEYDLIWKIMVPSVLFVLLVILLIFQIWVSKKEGNLNTSIKISFTYFILDLTVLVLFGSLMKDISFPGVGYKTIFITQCLVMIFNVVFNSILLSTFFRLTKKYMR